MKKKKILIVNESKNVLTKLSEDFKAEGIDVIATTKIEEAKWAVNNTFFDIVLVGIQQSGLLNRLDLEFLQCVHEKSQGTKVIIMNKQGPEEVEKKTYDEGDLLLLRQAL